MDAEIGKIKGIEIIIQTDVGDLVEQYDRDQSATLLEENDKIVDVVLDIINNRLHDKLKAAHDDFFGFG